MHAICHLSVSCALLAFATGSTAGTLSPDTAGVRGALSANNKSRTFEQAEAFATLKLPWHLLEERTWHLNSSLEISAGSLHGRTDTAFIGSVGPTFTLSRDHCPFSLGFGISPTLMSQAEYDGMNFGVPFQFTSHVGVNLELNKHLGIGYRYQHMSNAGLSHHNPGLNLHGLVLCYHF